MAKKYEGKPTAGSFLIEEKEKKVKFMWAYRSGYPKCIFGRRRCEVLGFIQRELIKFLIATKKGGEL